MRKRKTAGRPVSRDAVTGFEALHDPDRRDQALADLGQWVIDTCLIFGCRQELGWEVAALFVRGLRKDLEANNERTKRATKNGLAVANAVISPDGGLLA